MKKGKIYVILTIVGFFILLYAGFIVAEDSQIEAEPAAIVASDLQWLWGEVVSVDTPNKMLVVKYLDYDTDTEKEIAITTDEQTSFESIKSLEEVNLGDTVSVDYV